MDAERLRAHHCALVGGQRARHARHRAQSLHAHVAPLLGLQPGRVPPHATGRVRLGRHGQERQRLLATRLLCLQAQRVRANR